LKLKYGRIDRAKGNEVAQRIELARALNGRLDAIEQGREADPAIIQLLHGEVNAFSISTVCDKRELFWRRHFINYRLLGIMRVVWAYLRGLK
jgi:hypothetical protein